MTLLALSPQRSFAHAQQRPVPDGGRHAEHVRCLDAEACRGFAEALTASPTVMRMVEQLDGTDLIVGIESTPLEKVTRGQLRILAAVAGFRHLRIRLTVPLAPVVMTATLGHELQHALEIAAMPEVRDDLSLTQAYERIGFAARTGGYFETRTALATGRRAAEEAERSGRRVDDGARESGIGTRGNGPSLVAESCSADPCRSRGRATVR